MVLRSLHRLSPQALRFFMYSFSTERLLLVDSRGGLPIALSSFPGLPSFLRHWFEPDFVTFRLSVSSASRVGQ